VPRLSGGARAAGQTLSVAAAAGAAAVAAASPVATVAQHGSYDAPRLHGPLVALDVANAFVPRDDEGHDEQAVRKTLEATIRHLFSTMLNKREARPDLRRTVSVDSAVYMDWLTADLHGREFDEAAARERWQLSVADSEVPGRLNGGEYGMAVVAHCVRAHQPWWTEAVCAVGRGRSPMLGTVSDRLSYTANSLPIDLAGPRLTFAPAGGGLPRGHGGAGQGGAPHRQDDEVPSFPFLRSRSHL
jgi:hypothetical protein